MSELMEKDNPYGPLTELFIRSLLDFDRDSAAQLIIDAADKGMSLKDIYKFVFTASQYEIGNLWQTNRITVGDEHYCTAATQYIMSQLYSRMVCSEKKGFRIVVACVDGELHEMGARMVADLFEIEGWNSWFLGSATPADSIIAAVEKRNADVLAISSTLHSHIPAVGTVVEKLRATNACEHVKVLVGGRSFNVAPAMWKSMGADGYAPDAWAAVKIAQWLINEPAAAMEGQDQIKVALPACSKETLAAYRGLKSAIIEESTKRILSEVSPRDTGGKDLGVTVRSGLTFTSSMLEGAMSVGEPALLADEMKWASERLPHDGVSLEMIHRNLAIYKDVVQEKLEYPQAIELAGYLDWMMEIAKKMIRQA